MAKSATIRSMRRKQRILTNDGKVTSVALSYESLAALERAAELGLSQKDAINKALVDAWGSVSMAGHIENDHTLHALELTGITDSIVDELW